MVGRRRVDSLPSAYAPRNVGTELVRARRKPIFFSS